jgi:O-antigen/teichoic acid export membrane protein
MALSSVTTKLGASQTPMKSEVSGAAGAAGLVGFGNIAGSMLKYVSTFLIQYGFGAGGYGLYTLCLSLVNLVSAIFNLGLDDAMVRYVAIYRGKQQTKSLQGLLLFCTAAAGIAGLLGALLLLLVTPQLVTLWLSLKHHTLDSAATLARAIALLQVMAPVIPLMTMQVMWFAGLRGFKAFKWRVLSTSVLQPLLQILLMVVVVYLFRHDKNGITAVALVLLISTMFSTVLNMFFLLRQVSLVATPEPERYEVREWLTFAGFNFLTTIIDTVLDSIDTILLAVFGVTAVAIGQYGAAIRLSAFIAMPLLSLNNIFAPTIAELHSQGEMKRLESMFKIMTKWSIVFSLPIFLIMVLFSPFLLAIPGASFAPAWPLLIAFSLGAMINAGTGAVGYMLLMTGYQRLSFLNSLVAVAVNIGLGIWLTPLYGAMGTAISTGLAICALNLMRMLQVRMLLKMHPYRLDSLKPVAAGLISSVLIGLLLYLIYSEDLGVYLVIGHAILSVQLLLIPVFLALYIWFLVLFGGSPEDEIVLKAMRKKFMRGKGKNKKNMNKVKEA